MHEETKLQLALLDIKYKVGEVNLNEINWNKFFIDASNNRILYFCSKKIVCQEIQIPETIMKIIKETIIPKGEGYIKKTSNALEYLLEVLPKKNFEFLICKTQKIFDYITFDIDCLFKKNQFHGALAYLHLLGGEKINCEKKLQADIIMPGMIRMDMHDGFHWHKSEFIPIKYVWVNILTRDVYGVKNCKTPSLSNDLILTFLNLIYERHYVPLLDYHYLLRIHDKVEWDYIFKIASENQWDEALFILLEKFNFIHFFLFSKILIDLKKFKKGYTAVSKKNIGIPFLFTWREIFIVFKERLWKRKYFPWYEFFYALFAKTRFHIFGHKRVPIYGHWIDL